jgi:predicted DNA binding CopG/RHH family protein
MFNICITNGAWVLMSESVMTRSMRDEVVVRRDKAVAMAMRRKEEYLGARVPKELRDRVIQRATDMGIPVSILMRNILEEAFREEDPGQIIKEAPFKELPVTDDCRKFDAVLGWERIVLNKAVPCTSCGVQLPAGKEVTLGLGAAQPVVLCNVCKGGI